MNATQIQLIRDSLAPYEDDLKRVEQQLGMKAKTLAEALREQSDLPYFYDARKSELKQIIKRLELQKDKIRGRKYQHYVETYSRQLSERAINNYIDFDDDYIAVAELATYVGELHDKFAAVVDAFTRRGFALRDFTSALVNSLHEVVI